MAIAHRSPAAEPQPDVPNLASSASIVIDLGLSMGRPSALDQTPCIKSLVAGHTQQVKGIR